MLFSITTLIPLFIAITQTAVAVPVLTAREVWNGMEVPTVTEFHAPIYGNKPLAGASYSSLDNEIYEFLPDPHHFVVKVFAFGSDEDAKHEATILSHMGKLKAWGGVGKKFIVMNRVPGVPLDHHPDWTAAQGNLVTKKALIEKIAPKVAPVVLKICKEFGIHHDDLHEGNIMKDGDNYELVDWGVCKLHFANKCSDANLAEITAAIVKKLGG